MNNPLKSPTGDHDGSVDTELPNVPEAIVERAHALTLGRIDRAHQEIGDALFAYLTLPGSNPASDHLADDFNAAYRGDHATIDEAIDAQLEGLGWPSALKQMMHTNGIATGMLIWDLDLIKAQMDEVYDFVQHDGRVYQFIK
jgi:hypothetical protein